MPKEWIALVVNATGEVRELLIASLWKWGASGFVEDDKSFTAYVPADEWEASTSALFSKYCSELSREREFAPDISMERVQDQDWNREWEKTVQPVKVTDRLLIRPSWDASVVPEGTVVITIDPKMSFGTGYHETTRLMLCLLDRILVPGNRVLDVGTGTGILAIAAAKLGASFALAVDNDRWSFNNALENVSANGVESSVAIRFGSIGSVGEIGFNIVMANIHYSVIVEMMDELLEHLLPGGHLLISGILESDEESLRRLLSASGCRIGEILHEAEWIAISAERPGR